MDKIIEFAISALVGAVTLYLLKDLLIPVFGGWLQKAPNIKGKWQIKDSLDGTVVGHITISQIGKSVKATSFRNINRDGSPLDKEFLYTGKIHGSQLYLFYDTKGSGGFYSGVVCLKLKNSLDQLHGLTSYYDDDLGEVKSFPIYYIRS